MRLFTAIIKIFVEVDMEQVEHDPVHGGPKPGAQPPDASDHPLDQSLLVRVRVLVFVIVLFVWVYPHSKNLNKFM